MKKFEALLSSLESSDPAIRHDAAIELRDLGNNLAIEPLFKAIHKPENKNYRGTLVYALGGLDCSSHFLQIFDLALAESYEVRWGALTILNDQRFFVNIEVLNDAKAKLDRFSRVPNMCEDEFVELKSHLEEFLLSLKSLSN
jgi:HEAT repeat protein